MDEREVVNLHHIFYRYGEASAPLICPKVATRAGRFPAPAPYLVQPPFPDIDVEELVEALLLCDLDEPFGMLRNLGTNFCTGDVAKGVFTPSYHGAICSALDVLVRRRTRITVLALRAAVCQVFDVEVYVPIGSALLKRRAIGSRRVGVGVELQYGTEDVIKPIAGQIL